MICFREHHTPHPSIPLCTFHPFGGHRPGAGRARPGGAQGTVFCVYEDMGEDKGT